MIAKMRLLEPVNTDVPGALLADRTERAAPRALAAPDPGSNLRG